MWFNANDENNFEALRLNFLQQSQVFKFIPFNNELLSFF